MFDGTAEEVRDGQHRAELIHPNLVETDVNSQLQRAHQVEITSDEQALLRAPGGDQSVERAMVAAPALLLGRV